MRSRSQHLLLFLPPRPSAHLGHTLWPLGGLPTIHCSRGGCRGPPKPGFSLSSLPATVRSPQGMSQAWDRAECPSSSPTTRFYGQIYPLMQTLPDSKMREGMMTSLPNCKSWRRLTRDELRSSFNSPLIEQSEACLPRAGQAGFFQHSPGHLLIGNDVSNPTGCFSDHLCAQSLHWPPSSPNSSGPWQVLATCCTLGKLVTGPWWTIQLKHSPPLKTILFLGCLGHSISRGWYEWNTFLKLSPLLLDL